MNNSMIESGNFFKKGMIINFIQKPKKKWKLCTLPEPAMATTPREGLEEEGKERVEWTFRKKESEEEKG